MSDWIPDVVPEADIESQWGNKIRDRTVTPFASRAARAAAIPTPTEGMATWLRDEDALEVWDGVNWVGVGGTGGGAQAYRHVQMTAATTWTINHGLSFYPNVQVVDTLGRMIVPDVQYPTAGQVVLTFNPAAAGEAYLS